MKAIKTQQEILLITGTRFSSRLYASKDDHSNQDQLSDNEKLQEACWNGMIEELLPELREDVDKKKLFLWNIVQGDAFLELKFSNAPTELDDKHLSIDPYSFVPMQLLS
ncbi:MAG: hypothetical protein ACXWV9_05445 [Flavisolibacter sp.]